MSTPFEKFFELHKHKPLAVAAHPEADVSAFVVECSQPTVYRDDDADPNLVGLVVEMGEGVPARDNVPGHGAFVGQPVPLCVMWFKREEFGNAASEG